MSKLAEQLRAHKIYNDWGLLRRFGDTGKDVAVCYLPRPEGRLGFARCNKAVVQSPSFQTNPAAHWSNDGCKSFIGNRSESMPKALAWAAETYGITEWVPSPFGGAKIPKSVLDKAKEFVKGVPA